MKAEMKKHSYKIHMHSTPDTQAGLFIMISKIMLNVIFLSADDAGFEMATYRNRICQTPNFDALAKKSLIFNNAYTSVSSCSPR